MAEPFAAVTPDDDNVRSLIGLEDLWVDDGTGTNRPLMIEVDGQQRPLTPINIGNLPIRIGNVKTTVASAINAASGGSITVNDLLTGQLDATNTPAASLFVTVDPNDTTKFRFVSAPSGGGTLTEVKPSNIALQPGTTLGDNQVLSKTPNADTFTPVNQSSGGGGTVDQTARDAAATAQGTANTNAGDIDDLQSGQTTQDGKIRNLETSVSNLQTGKLDNPTNVGTDGQVIVKRGNTTRYETVQTGGQAGVDQTARDAAASAQSRADTAFQNAATAQQTADDANSSISGVRSSLTTLETTVSTNKADAERAINGKQDLLPTSPNKRAGRVLKATGTGQNDHNWSDDDSISQEEKDWLDRNLTSRIVQDNPDATDRVITALEARRNIREVASLTDPIENGIPLPYPFTGDGSERYFDVKEGFLDDDLAFRGNNNTTITATKTTTTNRYQGYNWIRYRATPANLIQYTPFGKPPTHVQDELNSEVYYEPEVQNRSNIRTNTASISDLKRDVQNLKDKERFETLVDHPTTANDVAQVNTFNDNVGPAIPGVQIGYHAQNTTDPDPYIAGGAAATTGSQNFFYSGSNTNFGNSVRSGTVTSRTRLPFDNQDYPIYIGSIRWELYNNYTANGRTALVKFGTGTETELFGIEGNNNGAATESGLYIHRRGPGGGTTTHTSREYFLVDNFAWRYAPGNRADEREQSYISLGGLSSGATITIAMNDSNEGNDAGTATHNVVLSRASNGTFSITSGASNTFRFGTHTRAVNFAVIQASGGQPARLHITGTLTFSHDDGHVYSFQAYVQSSNTVPSTVGDPVRVFINLPGGVTNRLHRSNTAGIINDVEYIIAPTSDNSSLVSVWVRYDGSRIIIDQNQDDQYEFKTGYTRAQLGLTNTSTMTIINNTSNSLVQAKAQILPVKTIGDKGIVLSNMSAHITDDLFGILVPRSTVNHHYNINFGVPIDAPQVRINGVPITQGHEVQMVPFSGGGLINVKTGRTDLDTGLTNADHLTSFDFEFDAQININGSPAGERFRSDPNDGRFLVDANARRDINALVAGANTFVSLTNNATRNITVVSTDFELDNVGVFKAANGRLHVFIDNDATSGFPVGGTLPSRIISARFTLDGASISNAATSGITEDTADARYRLKSAAITKNDLDSSLQSSINDADSALQPADVQQFAKDNTTEVPLDKIPDEIARVADVPAQLTARQIQDRIYNLQTAGNAQITNTTINTNGRAPGWYPVLLSNSAAGLPNGFQIGAILVIRNNTTMYEILYTALLGDITDQVEVYHRSYTYAATGAITANFRPASITQAEVDARVTALVQQFARDDTTVIPVAKIPNIDASKIASGTLAAGRIPNLDASKIASGTLAADRIPSIDYSKLSADARRELVDVRFIYFERTSGAPVPVITSANVSYNSATNSYNLPSGWSLNEPSRAATSTLYYSVISRRQDNQAYVPGAIFGRPNAQIEAWQIGDGQINNTHIAVDTIEETRLAPAVRTKLNNAGSGSSNLPTTGNGALFRDTNTANPPVTTVAYRKIVAGDMDAATQARLLPVGLTFGVS